MFFVTREKLKDDQHFKEYMTYENERILKFENAIEQVISERGEDDAVKATYIAVQGFYFNTVTALYSSGAPLEEIKTLFPQVIKIMKKCWNSDGAYVEMLWMISIGITLDVPNEQMEELKALIVKDGLKDFLMDTLIHSFDNEWEVTTHEFSNPVPYQDLKVVLETNQSEVALDALKTYLDSKWYVGHDDMGWYESHVLQEDTYSGYWSFESAALVKIKKLNDSCLSENSYYPYDLAHFVG